MHLELTSDDAQFLLEQLEHQLFRLDYEQVHTDHRALKRALADEIDRLRDLVDRVAALDGVHRAEPEAQRQGG